MTPPWFSRVDDVVGVELPDRPTRDISRAAVVHAPVRSAWTGSTVPVMDCWMPRGVASAGVVDWLGYLADARACQWFVGLGIKFEHFEVMVLRRHS